MKHALSLQAKSDALNEKLREKLSEANEKLAEVEREKVGFAS